MKKLLDGHLDLPEISRQMFKVGSLSLAVQDKLMMARKTQPKEKSDRFIRKI